MPLLGRLEMIAVIELVVVHLLMMQSSDVAA
jgi:hypothetical protein